jgi:hypothetical protein
MTTKVFQTLDALRQVVLDFWIESEDVCSTEEELQERQAILHGIQEQLDSLETRVLREVVTAWGAHDSALVRAVVAEFEQQSILNP